VREVWDIEGLSWREVLQLLRFCLFGTTLTRHLDTARMSDRREELGAAGGSEKRRGVGCRLHVAGRLFSIGESGRAEADQPENTVVTSEQKRQKVNRHSEGT
jgi:hypothetical protein